MSNLHVTQLVLAWAVIFLPGVGTGGGGESALFAGKMKKKYGYEAWSRKIFAFGILPYSLILFFFTIFGRQTFLWTVELTETDRNKNSCTGDEHGVVTGVVQTELTKVRNKKQCPYFSLFDTTFH